VKQIIRVSFALTVLLTAVVIMAGCGGNDDPVTPPPPPPPTILKVVVRSAADSSFVENSNVVLYRADNREAVVRDLTGPEGEVSFNVEVGNYYLNLSAQGFEPVPETNIAPIPFFVAAEDTTVQGLFLEETTDAGSTGYIQGYVEPAVNNFLILAQSSTGQDDLTTASGPDGFFILHNVAYGNYTIEALKAGYQMDEPAEAAISAQTPDDTVHVKVSEYVGSLITGSVTFLASENSTVDITLLDPETRSVVPGLTVMSDPGNLNYRIEMIPDGDYIAWASLKNDGYVIDPDWLFKNPGGLDLSFSSSDTVQLDFSVTDAIILDSPTNPADSTFAAMADSTVPTFRWELYPSAKEYFIEVKDLNGDVLWGGFDADGAANHGFIPAGTESVTYNFDGQPDAPELEPGQIYQWMIWADLGTKQDSFVEQLISSSEDLRGIFQVPPPPEPVE